MGLFKKNLMDCTSEEVRDAVQRDLDDDMARLDREFEESLKKTPTMEEIMAHPERFPTPVDYAREQRAKRIHHTNEERLFYYRSHGLTSCDDYPGGDARFEADVLSGAYHDEDGDMDELPREDVYIVGKMLDGTFLFGESFDEYGYNVKVIAAYNDVLHEIGVERFYERKK